MLTVWLLAGACLQGPAVPREVVPPTESEVLRAIGRPRVSVPLVFETYRDDVVVIRCKLRRQFRLLGVPASHWTGLWECSVFYTETVTGTFPVPYRLTRNRVEDVILYKPAVPR